MTSSYTRAVKAQLESVRDSPDGVVRSNLMTAAKKHAKSLWPAYHVGQGVWIKVLKDLIRDGSLEEESGTYHLSQDGLRTLAIADSYC